ncbi:DUF1295 domain protein [Zopfochytrium polystomum]|nr:DUF1295 domain protein [Zopfochytrium polystomum]
MAALVTAWGVRLTANFARKGGYNWHDQDYRWPYLRTQTFFSKSRIAWELFSLAFIHIYQNLLLFLTTLPTHVAFAALQASATSGATATTWTVYDTAAAAGFLAFLALESVADEQQWAFQSAKHAHLSRGTPLRDLPVTKPHPSLRYGFHTAGLFRYSRHPNFVGEFCIWWAYFGFSVGATASAASAAAAAVPWHAGLLNWTVVGTVLLTLLFQGSTAFTEYISVRKYPLYKVYQRHVPALIPWWPTRVDALERELKQAFDAGGEEDGQKKKVAATSKKSK